MLIHVDYLDKNGSVCYFCGQQLIVKEVVEKTYNNNNRVKAKTHLCTCPHGHICFIQMYYIFEGGTSQFNTNLQLHMFVFIDDYLEHKSIEPEEMILIPSLQLNRPLKTKGKFQYGKTEENFRKAWFKRKSNEVY